MRKWFLLIFLPLLLLITVTLAFFHLTNFNGKGYEIFAVYKTEIFVKEAGSHTEGWQASFTINDKTQIKDKDRRVLSLQDLKVGQIVLIETGEKSFVLTSDPPRLLAKEVVIIREP